MSKYVTTRDVAFFTGINKEVINDIIETPIVFYSLLPDKQDTNIYGESLDKIYEFGISVNALIQHDDEMTEEDGLISDVHQNIICAFHRNTLKEKDFYPERGDVIQYNTSYWEITNVIDNQFLAGRVGLPHSIICSANMTNRSSLNVREES